MPEYRHHLQQFARAKNERTSKLRTLAATIFSAAVGLPIVLDWRLIHWVLSTGQRGSATVVEATRINAKRAMALYLGWGMIFAAFAPFL